MAKRIYFPDGSHEDFLCPIFPENDMARIVRERLGNDFADMCDPYILGSEEEPTGDDYEKIADGYLSMLHGTADEIEALLDKFQDGKRLDRQSLFRELTRIHQNIVKNL